MCDRRDVCKTNRRRHIDRHRSALHVSWTCRKRASCGNKYREWSRIAMCNRRDVTIIRSPGADALLQRVVEAASKECVYLEASRTRLSSRRGIALPATAFPRSGGGRLAATQQTQFLRTCNSGEMQITVPEKDPSRARA
ncbi:uncharacterized protein LOC116847073 isoform X2 [Odontomachus brunneus]|uniref:uncharacterized protein LOC116847073 isoform X2 n=1 Tax=Odontomachus brunneus TaxID=486640 RepID=UPI0013F2A1CF|nr:uncharacterized protein LOC116847073 isoform X2 [Odontomachus brunneus]